MHRTSLLMLLVLVSCEATPKPQPKPEPKPEKFVLGPDTRNYDQLHLAAEIHPDWNDETVSVISTIRLKPLVDDFQTLIVHSEIREFYSILAHGHACGYEWKDGLLHIDLTHPHPKGEEIEVIFKYTCTPRHGFFFKQDLIGFPSIPKQIWTQGEGINNRHWLPCYDLPDDRLTSELLVTVPSNMEVISNGRLAATADQLGGLKTWHWKQEQEHVTYLISVVAGKFDVVKTDHDIPFYYYMPPGTKQHAETSFGRTPAMMDFFQEYIAEPWPWAKRYSQTTVWDFLWGGMENTGVTTLNMRAVHDERAHLDYSADYLIAHELVHNWFGDLITCRTFDHIWLNEGITTYFTDLFVEKHYGVDELQRRRIENNDRYLDGNDRDALAKRTLPADPKIPTGVSTSPYQKGSAVCHMLRFVMGDDKFREGMRRYVQDNKGKSIPTENFIASMEKVHGESLDWFAKQWLYRGIGYPEFFVEYTYDEDRGLLLHVKQMQQIGGKYPLFRMPVRIWARDVHGEITKDFVIDEREEVFELGLKSAPHVVVFDKGGWLLKKLDFRKPMSDWRIQLTDAPDAGNRIEAARALASFGERGVPALALGLKDKYWAVRRECVRSITKIRRGPELHKVMNDLQSGTGAYEGLKALRSILRKPVDSRWLKTVEQAAEDTDSQVRQAAMEALGTYPPGEVEKRLIERLGEDESYYVRAEAALALAMTQSENAFEFLLKGMTQDSHRDIIRHRIMQGFAVLGDPRGLPVAKEHSHYRHGKGRMHRNNRAAIDTYVLLEPDRKKRTDFLVSHLKNPYFRSRTSAANWLKFFNAWEALPALHEAHTKEKYPPVQNDIKRAIDWLDPK